MFHLYSNIRNAQKYVDITLKHNKLNPTIDINMSWKKKCGPALKADELVWRRLAYYLRAAMIQKISSKSHPDELSTQLTPAKKLWLQENVGIFFFYARAIDSTMYTAINKIGSKQEKPTSLIKKQIKPCEWPDATMQICASNMKSF